MRPNTVKTVMKMNRTRFTLCVFGAFLLSATPAEAQLDEAQDHFAAAEFEAAVRAYERAEEGELTRDELVGLLRGRALAQAALGRDSEAERDMRALLSIEPGAELGLEAPPSLQRRFDALRADSGGALSVESSALPTSGGWRIRVNIEDDPGRLERQTIVYVREGGEFVPHEARRGRVRLSDLEGQDLEYYVEVFGPGEVVLAREGARSDPLVIDAPQSDVASPIPPIEEEEDRTLLWVGIGAGAAAVVIAVIIAVAVSGSSSTQPSIPMEVP